MRQVSGSGAAAAPVDVLQSAQRAGRSRRASGRQEETQNSGEDAWDELKDEAERNRVALKAGTDEIYDFSGHSWLAVSGPEPAPVCSIWLFIDPEQSAILLSLISFFRFRGSGSGDDRTHGVADP